MGIDTRIVPLSRLNSPADEGLRLTQAEGRLDPRLVALVRLLARPAADEYCDRAAAPKEVQPPRR